MKQDDLNKKFPINISTIQDIIDRVSKRYPLVEKHEITRITKVFFEVLRKLLFDGHSISLTPIFTNMHLYHFNKIWNNKFQRIVKVKLKTSDKIKYM
jgi:nucleoid DNA-binding protein